MGKHHDKEYKEFVSKLIVEEGRKATDVAHELELPYSTILKWTQEYKKKVKSGQSGEKFTTPSELEKIKKEYERKMRLLEEENEILKKAMHIFTKNQQ
jgi:transposase